MPRTLPRLPMLLLSALALLSVCAANAFAADNQRQKRFDANASAFSAAKQNIPVRDPGPPPGAEVLDYKFGPMKIKPGQNVINIDIQKQRPDIDGYIVGFRPGLIYADGTSPSVKVVHLHHAVWLVGAPKGGPPKPTFAAGEEKTYFNAPRGFGWRYTTDQTWLINHMIHDLTSQPQEVYITYRLWFIPDTAPEAANITRMETQWMDVEGVKPYPVFDVKRKSGTNGRFTYPDQRPNAYASADGYKRNEWIADHDGTMVNTAGHLHPGGLWTDLKITRDGVTKRIFRSRANYFEPTGPVSWDVAMSATAEDWRVNFKKGDVISTSATYDTSRASWYEVMGIMVVGKTMAPVEGGVDPFTGEIDQTDRLTHGRLKENIDENVRLPTGLRNPIARRAGPYKDRITIRNFVYSQGDLSRPGKAGRPPQVRQGKSLTFVNADNPLTVRFHTVTACKAPCTKSGGIGYPLANGPFGFDSGELGYGPTISQALYATEGPMGSVPITAAINKPAPKEKCADVPGIVKAISDGCVGETIFKTPKNLTPGTYAYFCRVHPFMRGAFRVVNGNKQRAAG